MSESSAGPKTSQQRRGRPPVSGPRELELIALRLFLVKGYEQTTVLDIASEAGITRRSFHRYFSSKADVLWHGFDDEIERLSAELAESGDAMPVHETIHAAVLAVNRYTAEDIPELRSRMELIGSVPALQASAASRYDAWERAISGYVASRTGASPSALYPLLLGRTVLAACRTAFDLWVRQGDRDLGWFLDTALDLLLVDLSEPAEPDLAK